jgi:nucleoid-associated protein YgaU
VRYQDSDPQLTERYESPYTATREETYEEVQAPEDQDHIERYDPVDEAGYDWDYQEGRRGPNILWGRIAALLGLLLLIFLLGRATVDPGISEATYDQTRKDLADAESRIQQLEGDNINKDTKIDELESKVADLQKQLEEAPTTSAAAAADTGGATNETFSGRVHIVQEGQTLPIIAEKYYEDPTLADFLADFNDLEDPDVLLIGQELLIPDRPEL